MAHYAFVNESGRVVRVIAGNDETADYTYEDWEAYYGNNVGMTCVRTSYNTRGGVHYTDGEPSDDQTKAFRKNYAGAGMTYDSERDAFIPPKPFESWVLSEQTCLWEAPIPYPADGAVYSWDEASGDWVQVVEPSA